MLTVQHMNILASVVGVSAKVKTCPVILSFARHNKISSLTMLCFFFYSFHAAASLFSALDLSIRVSLSLPPGIYSPLTKAVYGLRGGLAVIGSYIVVVVVVVVVVCACVRERFHMSFFSFSGWLPTAKF